MGAESPKGAWQPPNRRLWTALPSVLGALAVVLCVVGLMLLAWPVLTDWQYAMQADGAIQEATSTYDALSDPERQECERQARAYNDRMAAKQGQANDSGDALQAPGEDGQAFGASASGAVAEELWDYEWQLTWQGTPESMIAWVDIPRIATKLPIYHGTSDAVLMAGVGHLEWTALPIGGEGTHCVLTAHSGMDRTRMFDDIRLLQPGDVFVLWTLNEPYAYEVTGSQVVLPDEVSLLAPVAGRDLCTLVTCEPFGVNTHRLLVTGERCEYDPSMGVTPNASAYVSGRAVPVLLAGTVVVVLAGAAVGAWLRRRKAKIRHSRAL